MTIFYQGPCAHVTHEVFETRYPHYRCFMIRDIRQLYLARRAAPPGSSQRSPVRAGSAGIAGIAAVAAAFGWPALSAAAMPPIATAGLAGMLVLIAVSSLAFAACVRIQASHVHELWAVYRGRTICLFGTTDERTFGQVKRALVRAIEQRGGVDPETDG
jgi:Family of unknown function (DUF6232)